MTEKLTKYLNLFILSKNFTEKELKEAYRDLAHVWHPDKHNHNKRLCKKAENQIKEINEGYEFLKQILENGFTTTSYYSKPHAERSDKSDSQSQNSESKYKSNGRNEKNEEQKTDLTPKIVCLGLIPVILYVLFVVFIVSQSKKSNYSTENSSYDSHQAVRKISKKLDEKNGFKQFQFSMSVSEAEKIHQPTNRIEIENTDNTILFYEKNKTMNIGKYTIDTVNLHFFKDMLYRIDIKISSYQSEIYQTFKHAFGQPYENSSWNMGEQPLRAKSWEGDFVLCTILAEKKSIEETGWNTIVIYDKKIYQQSSEYEENEPIRASKDIHNDGLGSIHLKMDIKDFIKLFKSTPNVIDSEFEQKTVFVSEPKIIKIGCYSLDNIKGFFFKNKLYRFDVNFSDKRKKIFKAFISRFPNSSQNNLWTQRKQKLTALEFLHENNVALILAPNSKDPQWETLIFYNIDLMEKKDQTNWDIGIKP